MEHIIADIIRNSILITGLVTIMMMLIESLNIESKGEFFSGLKKSKTGQVVFYAFLGAIPGCMGGFAAVSLYTHKMLSFGALVAMMIATSGDESFMMIAMIPDKAVWIFALTTAIAIAAGIITDLVYKPVLKTDNCKSGFALHKDALEAEGKSPAKKTCRHLSLHRIIMSGAVLLFVGALLGGMLEHSHTPESEIHASSVNLLSEEWMNWMFAVLSIIVVGFLSFGSDHFIEEHLWKHIVKKHLPGIFLWTIGVLSVVDIGLVLIDLDSWMSQNTALMIIIAALVGIIPESGPHLIFLTLYAEGIVPLPVLLASCISQDGHASIPLLAESKKRVTQKS